MGAETVLAGIAGALRGGTESYRWQSDRRDRRAAVEEQNRARQDEIARKSAVDKANESERQRQIQAQQAIIESMPDTNPDGSPNTVKMALRVQYAQPKGTLGNTLVKDAGDTTRTGMTNASRETVAGINADSASNVAGINQQGANYRHDTVSGDTGAREAGQDRRTKMNINFGTFKVNTEDATARRGQDMTSSTVRRGQDLTSETTRRGQDNTFQLGKDRNDILKTRRVSPYDALFPPPPVDGSVPPAAAAPVAAPAKGTIPVTSRPSQSAATQPAVTPRPVDDITDADLDTLAKSILDSQGIPSTPQNVKTFKDRNHDKLILQIKTVRGGGTQ